MKILANENVPLTVVTALRRAGHDVAWVQEEDRGASDAHVLERARRQARTVLTFDKGYGELLFRRGLRADSGVLLVRLPPLPAVRLATIIAAVLASRDDWSGSFAVVTENQVRVTPLPGAPQR